MTVLIVSKSCIEQGCEVDLQEISRRKPVVNNRAEGYIGQADVQTAASDPAPGQVRMSGELRKNGVFVLPGGINSIRLRHDMGTFRKRLKSLFSKTGQEGVNLGGNQVAALENEKEEGRLMERLRSFISVFLVRRTLI